MSAYSQAVLADSPLFYWRVPFTGAQAFPSIGSHGEWAAVGSAAGYQFGWSGPGQDAGSWLGISAVALFGQSSVVLAAPYTLECWVYQGGHQPGTVQTSSSYFQVNSPTPATAFFGFGSSGGNWTYIANAGPSTTTAVGWTALAWHLVDLVVSSTGIQLLVDGAVAFSTALTPTTLTGFSLAGGRTESHPEWLAEYAIYPSALTTGRCAAHYAAGSLAAPAYTQGLAKCG